MGKGGFSLLPESEWTRRSVLKSIGIGGLACLFPKRVVLSAAGVPVALQLYSVRGDCSTDFDAALEKVSAMGFAGVEFAGYHSYEGKPKELRKRLDDLQLKAAGTHIATDLLRPEALQKTIDFHQTLGCTFLIVPSDRSFSDPEGSKELAHAFNRAAEALKPLGMACGYHNHLVEFRKDGEKTYWELFAERTTQDVVLQLDCGWCAAAGQDPAALIRKYPNRTRTVHFKPTVVRGEEGKKAILGQDSVDWAGVYAACISSGGTEWIVLEQELYPDGKSAMECTELSFAGLRQIISGPGTGGHDL